MEDRKIRVAINGFGRIGRSAFKIAFERDDIEIVAINDLGNPENLAYLLKYDSVYGTYQYTVSSSQFAGEADDKNTPIGELHVGETVIPIFSLKSPSSLPWNNLGVDIVIESTGVFTHYEDAKAHIEAGAKRVIISAPAKGEEGQQGKTVVLGTEDTKNHLSSAFGSPSSILSNASCTTNCVAPVMQVLHSSFGVEKSLMTTVHGYTASQNLVDGPNKIMRRGRAAALNIVPSSTGAAKATGHVIPEIAKNFDGVAMRVPVAVGSISDIVAVLQEDVTTEKVNQAFEKATQNPLFQDVLAVTRDPIVSSDIIGSNYSAIVDLEYTRVVGGNLVKVLAWYDNEWGYSNRLVEVVAQVGKQLS